LGVAEEIAEAKNVVEVAAEVEHSLAETATQVIEIHEQVSVAEEAKRAAKICTKSKEAVISMFKEARLGNAVSIEAATELVEEITASVYRNPGALISLARLKTADDYTYMHSVAVCAMMVALARQLKLEDSVVREMGTAGLMHDLGKALMPMSVLNKPGKLTDEEFAIIKSHPESGYKLLVEGNAAGEIIKDVCIHHHEKVDGSGYPHHLKGEAISLHARMGAICDVYDAITSNRPYKTGWDPAESIRKMTEWKGHFDERLFQAFVKSIGIYPIGSLVRLESGRLAIVIDQGEKSLLTPNVKVFFSAKQKTYITPEVVELGRPGATDKIVGREDVAKWGFKDLDKYWMA
jgi:putative nucleotidyltransferase with HDIG domain